MSWYIHPSKQLREDELTKEFVVTNEDGSIEQVYVPFQVENDMLQELFQRVFEAVMLRNDAEYDGLVSEEDS